MAIPLVAKALNPQAAVGSQMASSCLPTINLLFAQNQSRDRIFVRWTLPLVEFVAGEDGRKCVPYRTVMIFLPSEKEDKDPAGLSREGTLFVHATAFSFNLPLRGPVQPAPPTEPALFSTLLSPVSAANIELQWQ